MVKVIASNFNCVYHFPDFLYKCQDYLLQRLKYSITLLPSSSSSLLISSICFLTCSLCVFSTSPSYVLCLCLFSLYCMMCLCVSVLLDRLSRISPTSSLLWRQLLPFKVETPIKTCEIKEIKKIYSI